MKISDEGTGTLVATLKVDAKGNFYTINNADFSAGRVPSKLKLF